MLIVVAAVVVVADSVVVVPVLAISHSHVGDRYF